MNPTFANIVAFFWLAYLVFGLWRGIGSLNPDAMSAKARRAWFVVNAILACTMAALLFWVDWLPLYALPSTAGLSLEELESEGLVHGVVLFVLCLAVFRAWRCLRVYGALTMHGGYDAGFYRRYGHYPD